MPLASTDELPNLIVDSLLVGQAAPGAIDETWSGRLRSWSNVRCGLSAASGPLAPDAEHAAIATAKHIATNAFTALALHHSRRRGSSPCCRALFARDDPVDKV